MPGDGDPQIPGNRFGVRHEPPPPGVWLRLMIVTARAAPDGARPETSGIADNMNDRRPRKYLPEPLDPEVEANQLEHRSPGCAVDQIAEEAGEVPGTSETRQSAGSRKWPHRSPRLSLS